MIQKNQLAILLFLICIVNGNYNGNSNDNYNKKSSGNYGSSYSGCKRFENKNYLLKVTFPGGKPLYAVLRLQPNGVFDELFSIANGNNAAEVGANFSLSNRYGYYKCLYGNAVRLTGLGFLYKTPEVSFLSENGAIVIHDYYFRFYDHDKSLTGSVKFAVFKSGTNPFSTNDKPVNEGPLGLVEGDLLTYHTYYKLY